MAADDGWEARMAARAAARRTREPSVRVFGGTISDARDQRHIRSWMTLGDLADALQREPFGCACCGPPNCCINVAVVGRELQRGAHIVVKQLGDLARRKETDHGPTR